MALLRIASEIAWKSTSGGQTYSFIVSIDANGLLTVRDIQTPTGYLVNSYAGLPNSVVADIEKAKSLTLLQLGTSQVETGTVAFVAETSKTVLLSTTLNNTSYSVEANAADGTAVTVSDLTTDSFVVTTATTFTGNVSYAVTQKAMNTGSSSGSIVFTAATGPQQSVTFSSAQVNSDYIIVLSEDGFYSTRVVSKTRAGFTVALSFSPRAAESFTVNYEIFA